MNLHIVKMLQCHIMLLGHLQGIPRQAREIGRVLIEAADTASSQHRIRCMDMQHIAGAVLCHNTCTAAILHQDILHDSVLPDFHIRQLPHMPLQGFRNLLAGHILMKADARL